MIITNFPLYDSYQGLLEYVCKLRKSIRVMNEAISTPKTSLRVIKSMAGIGTQSRRNLCIHGDVSMYWEKKILEWSKKFQEGL